MPRPTAAAVLALTLAAAVALTSVQAASSAAPVVKSPVYQFWSDLADCSCKTKWTTTIADNYLGMAMQFGITATGLPIANYNSSALMGACGLYCPAAGPSLAMNDDVAAASQVTWADAKWSRMTLVGAVIAGPAAAGGTANCTATSISEETAIVDDDGNYVQTTDVSTYPENWFTWMQYCQGLKPLPKPDPTPSADIVAYVENTLNYILAQECDNAAAQMSSNFTATNHGYMSGQPSMSYTKASYQQGCAKSIGSYSQSGTAVSKHVTGDGNSVQLEYVASGTIKDGKTGQQCTLFTTYSSTVHTIIEGGVRVIDNIETYMDPSWNDSFYTKCHYNPEKQMPPRFL